MNLFFWIVVIIAALIIIGGFITLALEVRGCATLDDAPEIVKESRAARKQARKVSEKYNKIRGHDSR